MDLTEEYCATARRLNQLAGLDDRISLRQGDVTDLPFEDATFTLIISQHVQMNVADKALLYAEARRVLVDSGRLALWDIVASEDGKPDIPLPWADRPEYSHLTTSDRLRTTIETSGFEIEQWNDLTGGHAGSSPRPSLRLRRVFHLMFCLLFPRCPFRGCQRFRPMVTAMGSSSRVQMVSMPGS